MHDEFSNAFECNYGLIFILLTVQYFTLHYQHSKSKFRFVNIELIVNRTISKYLVFHKNIYDGNGSKLF